LTAAFYIAVILLSDKRIALCGIICSVIHELGHYFAARALGSDVKSFVLYPFGAEMTLDGLRSYKTDVTVALLGPLINVIAAAVGWFFGTDAIFVLYNLTLAALNLLPIRYLDGGSILSALLTIRFDPIRAEKLVNAVSFSVLLLLWMLSVYIFMMQGGSPSLFFISVTLFASVFLRDNV
jgi:stage IV sporulation protein FB